MSGIERAEMLQEQLRRGSRSTEGHLMHITDPNILQNLLQEQTVFIPHASLIAAAADYTLAIHADQIRKDGTPYSLHLFRVAIRLEESGCTSATAISTALLHDAMEDQKVLPSNIMNHFGMTEGLEIALGVAALSNRIGPITYDNTTYYANIKDASNNFPNLYLLEIKFWDRYDNLLSYLQMPQNAVLPASDKNPQRTVREARITYMKNTEEFFLDLLANRPDLMEKLQYVMKMIRRKGE